MRQQIDIKKIQGLAKKYDIESAGIFGSRARGDAREDSDLDLLVKFRGVKSLLEMIKIQNELSESLKLKVDLLTTGSISPYLRERILAEVKPVL